MTEQEWMQATDPQPMLEFLRRKTNDRKLRLWECACCRQIWQLLSDTGRIAIEATEEWAVGRVSGRKLDRISRQIYSEIGPFIPDARNDSRRYAAAAVWRATSSTAHQITHTAHQHRPVGAWGFAIEAKLASDSCNDLPVTTAAEYEKQCTLLRDIIGNPFRSVAIEHVCLVWNERIVAKLAQAIYDERAFDRLPILADALEEAGCEDQDILSHCRSGGEHVRGCWVIDTLLGKS